MTSAQIRDRICRELRQSLTPAEFDRISKELDDMRYRAQDEAYSRGYDHGYTVGSGTGATVLVNVRDGSRYTTGGRGCNVIVNT